MKSSLATLAALALGLVSCGGAFQNDIERRVDDTERGVRYVVPAGWKSFDGEIRSRGGTLLSVRVYDLVEADKTFVAGLPDTLVPKLLEWAKYYYIVLGGPTRAKTTVAGLPALEISYPIRVRPKDDPSKVVYWVVTRKTRVFVIRAAFPPAMLPKEEPVVRKVVEGWGFLEQPGEASD